MTDAARWVPLVECASGLEADMLRAALEAEEIPVLVQGTQVGIYGGAFQGPVLGGAVVYVPSPELERARALLDGRGDDGDDGGDGDDDGPWDGPRAAVRDAA